MLRCKTIETHVQPQKFDVITKFTQRVTYTLTARVCMWFSVKFRVVAVHQNLMPVATATVTVYVKVSTK